MRSLLSHSGKMSKHKNGIAASIHSGLGFRSGRLPISKAACLSLESWLAFGSVAMKISVVFLSGRQLCRASRASLHMTPV